MATIIFKSFFGLSLEINVSKGKVTLKQDNAILRSWKKNDKDMRNLCRELRLDAGENRQEITGWVIVKLLRGEKLNKPMTRLSKLQIA